MKKKIGILGAGTWGTALANMLAHAGHDVFLWSIQKEELETLAKTRVHKHLPGCVLSKKINYCIEIAHACEGMDVVVFATPSIAVRSTAELAKPHLDPKTILVTVAKGIEESTLLTTSEIINDVVGEQFKVVALSGPTHAEEVAIGMPTLIVAAYPDLKVAEYIQDVFSNNTLRVYTNHDIKGVELCGALKNIIALACGIAEGAGAGDNGKAALITRGLHEITSLGLAMGCELATFAGLTGIGDIVVTGTSKHSRNHNCGVLIGQGVPYEEAITRIGMVVEGINAMKAAIALGEKYNVELPIINVVSKVLKGEIGPLDVTPILFARKKKHELKH